MFRTQGKNFSIEDGKLNAVWIIIQANLPRVNFRQIQEFILSSDWSEGGHLHQEWLDTVSPEEIADWVIVSNCHGELDD